MSTVTGPVVLSWPESWLRPLEGCRTILDLGSSRGSRLNKLCGQLGAHGVGIEYDVDRVACKRWNTSTEILWGDACKVVSLVGDQSFDAVTLWDFLICLPKDQAELVVEQAKRVAKRVVAASLITDGAAPRLSIDRSDWSDHPSNEQRSLWSLEEAAHLLGEGTAVEWDPDYIERYHARQGREFVEKLRTEGYFGVFPKMALVTWHRV